MDSNGAKRTLAVRRVNGAQRPSARAPALIEARRRATGGFPSVEELMDLAQVTARITEAVGANSGLGKTLKFDFGDNGKIYIDGVATPNTVSNDDKPADCTLQLGWDDFLNMSQGKLDPTMAFMQGKLKVLGDMSIAMKLQPILAKLR
jgi:putative sterol carrier protein